MPTRSGCSALPSADAGARQYLARDALQPLLVGKSHSLEEFSTRMRWDLRSSGLLYYNSTSTTQQGVSGSGRWELTDDGRLCVRFNTASPLRPGDARRPDSGCWHFFREAGKLMRIGAPPVAGQPPVEIVPGG